MNKILSTCFTIFNEEVRMVNILNLDPLSKNFALLIFLAIAAAVAVVVIVNIFNALFDGSRRLGEKIRLGKYRINKFIYKCKTSRSH